MSIYDHFEYYKKNYKAFTRPNLTANGTMGGSSFACDQQSYYNGDKTPQQAWYVLTVTIPQVVMSGKLILSKLVIITG